MKSDHAWFEVDWGKSFISLEVGRESLKSMSKLDFQLLRIAFTGQHRQLLFELDINHHLNHVEFSS